MIAAAELLDKDFGVTADIWSCPSFNELARDGQDAERHNRFHPEAKIPRKPWITQQFEGCQGPTIVAADYIRAYREQVRAYVPMHRTVLDTDGYGRSDARENLRRFFDVDRFHVAQAAITALAAEGKMTAKDVSRGDQALQDRCGEAVPAVCVKRGVIEKGGRTGRPSHFRVRGVASIGARAYPSPFECN